MLAPVIRNEGQRGAPSKLGQGTPVPLHLRPLSKDQNTVAAPSERAKLARAACIRENPRNLGLEDELEGNSS